MRSNKSDQSGLVDPSSPADSTGSRTSIRTMALVVLAFVLIALFSRFGSDPLSTSTTESLTEGSDIKKNDPATGIQRKIQPVDCAFLSTLEDTIHSRRQSIVTYWNVSNYPNFLSMMSIPTRSWNIQKAKYMKLLLEANTEYLENQLKGQNSNTLTFIAGFSGSSVTAGHGKHYDSYLLGGILFAVTLFVCKTTLLLTPSWYIYAFFLHRQLFPRGLSASVLRNLTASIPRHGGQLHRTQPCIGQQPLLSL